jgi:hypothetical protein
MNPFDQTSSGGGAFSPSGDITSTTIRDAISELDGDKAPKDIREVVTPSSITMSASNVYGKRHTNYGQSADAILTYNAGAAGQSGEVSIATTVAKYYRLSPPSSVAFMLDGVVLAANQTVQVASASEGDRIDWDTVQIGAAEWRIRLWVVSGPWLPV